MKVNDPQLTNLMPSQVGGAEGAEPVGEKSKRTEGGASGGLDLVTLSTLGDKVRALDADSPERAAYLEKLSGDVQARRYNADPLEVSKKIVADAMREASGKGKE